MHRFSDLVLMDRLFAVRYQNHSLVVSKAHMEMGVGAHHFRDLNHAQIPLLAGQENMLRADAQNDLLGFDLVFHEPALFLRR